MYILREEKNKQMPYRVVRPFGLPATWYVAKVSDICTAPPLQTHTQMHRQDTADPTPALPSLTFFLPSQNPAVRGVTR